MGFFKDFKDDLSDAVDDMIPSGNSDEKSSSDDVMVNTIDEDVDVKSELSKLDGLLEKAHKKADSGVQEEAPRHEAAPVQEETPAPQQEETYTEERKEETGMAPESTNDNAGVYTNKSYQAFEPAGEVSDETAVITEGMTITGDLESTGSIQVDGTIRGNVKCNGKLVVTGVVRGNSTASEFFADSAKMEGEVVTSGTAKIGAGSVIVGNITATSAVIAGAVKGDIDVQGPVVVDTSAVVMGNIKSRSVQINNGAVIEGFCSQSYADVDVSSVFADVDPESVQQNA